MAMRFEPLGECSQVLQTVAGWHFAEWGHLYPDQTLADFVADLRDAAGMQAVPSAWVLRDQAGVWGSACVNGDDMASHPELSPWLANVFIHPDQRGRGLGRMLVVGVMDVARELGLTRLHLFTSDQEAFYRRLGWRTLFRETYHGEDVSVMVCDL